MEMCIGKKKKKYRANKFADAFEIDRLAIDIYIDMST